MSSNMQQAWKKSQRKHVFVNFVVHLEDLEGVYNFVLEPTCCTIFTS